MMKSAAKLLPDAVLLYAARRLPTARLIFPKERQ
jgi:hypothetical protein